MPAIRLRPNPFVEKPSGQAAYDACLALESDTHCEYQKMTNVVAGRLLGHLLYVLDELGQYSAVEALSHDIDMCCGQKYKLLELAYLFAMHYVRIFKRARGPTPAPSESPYGPDSDDEAELMRRVAEEVNLDHRTAKKAALRREHWRCAVTGALDRASVLANKVEWREGLATTRTEAAHVVPQSINANINTNDNEEAHYAGHVWRILSMLGSPQIRDELNGQRVHRLANVITMDKTVHEEFNSLNIWFEHESGNRYAVRTAHPFLQDTVPDTVVFREAEGLPPPSKEYLALHAVACKVAHMSGAAEYLDDIDRETEDTSVLAIDGSSAHLLNVALTLVSPGH